VLPQFFVVLDGSSENASANQQETAPGESGYLEAVSITERSATTDITSNRTKALSAPHAGAATAKNCVSKGSRKTKSKKKVPASTAASLPPEISAKKGNIDTSTTVAASEGEQLDLLTSLGFEPEMCLLGLDENDGTVTGAVEWILHHQHQGTHSEDSGLGSRVEGYCMTSDGTYGGKANTLSKNVSTERKALGDSTCLQTKKQSIANNRSDLLITPKAKPPPKAAAAAKGTTKGSITSALEKMPASTAPVPMIPPNMAMSHGKFVTPKVVPMGSAPPVAGGAVLFPYPDPGAASLASPGVTGAPDLMWVPSPSNVPPLSYEEGEEEDDEEEQRGGEQLSGELLVSATLVPKDSTDGEEQQQQVALARATPLTPYEAAKVFLQGQGKFCLVASLCVIAATIAIAVGLTVGCRGEEEIVAGATSVEGWGENCTGDCKKECDEVLRWKHCKVGMCNPAHVELNCSGYEFNMTYGCHNKSSCNALKGICRNDCHALL